MLKLDLGAGPHRADATWTTVDVLPQWNPDLLLNLGKDPWPWPDGGVGCAFSNHVLEHLALDGALHFLRELRRVLKPGAWARVGVPDARAACRAYLDGRLWQTWHPEDGREPLWDLALILGGAFRNPATGQPDGAHTHRSCWDEPALGRAFKEAGWGEPLSFFSCARGSKCAEFAGNDAHFWRYGRGTLYVEVKRG